VNSDSDSATGSRRSLIREIVIYGLCGGALIAALQLLELRFLFIDGSLLDYGALVGIYDHPTGYAALPFATFPVGLVFSVVAAAILRSKETSELD